MQQKLSITFSDYRSDVEVLLKRLGQYEESGIPKFQAYLENWAQCRLGEPILRETLIHIPGELKYVLAIAECPKHLNRLFFIHDCWLGSTASL